MVKALVVGAGPTGLLMAAELTRYGVPCRVIDQRSAPSKKSKALVIQPRTLEVFQRIGIADRFIQQGLKLKAANLCSEGVALAHIPFSLIDSPFSYILNIEQSKTEQILIEHLQSVGVAVERNVKLSSFKQTEDCVLYCLESGEEGRADYLLGCDGAHSTVRSGLNIPFEGASFSDVFSLADIHLQWGRPHDEIFAFLDASGVVAAFPLPDKNRYRLVFTLPRCRDQIRNLSHDVHGEVKEIPPPTLEETRQLFERVSKSDIVLSDPIWMTNFHINSRLASRYRVGRVFLAGDASHIHSPIGGQGMNTGLQDAFNLAWKIGFVTQKKSDPALLDSYEEERKYVGRALLSATEKASYAATLRHPAAVYARNLAITFFGSFTAVKRKLAAAIAEIAIAHPSGRFIDSGRSLRAPDFSLTVEGRKTTLFQLLEKSCDYCTVVCKEHIEIQCKDLHVAAQGDPPSLYRNQKIIIRPDGYISKVLKAD